MNLDFGIDIIQKKYISPTSRVKLTLNDIAIKILERYILLIQISGKEYQPVNFNTLSEETGKPELVIRKQLKLLYSLNLIHTIKVNSVLHIAVNISKVYNSGVHRVGNDFITGYVRELLKQVYIDGFCEKIPLKIARGIYFLYRGNTLVYIGKAGNISKRIIEHINYKDFDSYCFKEFDCDDDELGTIEALFIKKYKPEYNVHSIN